MGKTSIVFVNFLLLDDERKDYFYGACSSLNSVIYHTKGGDFQIRFEWGGLLGGLRDQSDFPVEVPVSVFGGELTRFAVANDNRANHLAEIFMHDLFIVLNIGCPGAGDFWNASTKSTGKCSQLRLANSPFDEFDAFVAEFGLPLVGALEFSRMWSWYKRAVPVVRQVASSPIERGFYSLLYVARDGGNTPASVVWITQALESLCGAPDGKVLRSRVSAVLGVSKCKSKVFDERLRDLFKDRHGFVHGFMELPHPARNDILDDAFLAVFEKSVDAITFGSCVLIAFLRVLASKGWIDVQFTENVSGH